MTAWREAQAAGGRFLVRLEDIDTGRCRPEFESAVLDDLCWLGLAWEEPVWRQSLRLDAHAQALDRLEQLGLLYPCFCTRQEIATAASAPQGGGLEGLLYPGTCRRLSAGQRQECLAAGRPCAWRLDVAKAAAMAGPLSWWDKLRGEFPAHPELLGDAVLARKEMRTSYHLAVTVDDAAQEVTLVTRGEDLLVSTHLHRLLQALLGLPVPHWKHHALVGDAHGRRLSKRDQARSLRSFREAGVSATEVVRLAEQSLLTSGG